MPCTQPQDLFQAAATWSRSPAGPAPSAPATRRPAVSSRRRAPRVEAERPHIELACVPLDLGATMKSLSLTLPGVTVRRPSRTHTLRRPGRRRSNRSTLSSGSQSRHRGRARHRPGTPSTAPSGRSCWPGPGRRSLPAPQLLLDDHPGLGVPRRQLEILRLLFRPRSQVQAQELRQVRRRLSSPHRAAPG